MIEKFNIIKEIKNSTIIDNIKEVSLLGKGGFSDCYLLKNNEKSYVLKIRRDKQIERLEREYKLLSQKQIAKNNLAPQIIKFDKSYKKIRFPYLLEELVKGVNPKKTKINYWFIQNMATWYRELHSIKTNKLEDMEVKRINSISFWTKENFKEFKKLTIN